MYVSPYAYATGSMHSSVYDGRLRELQRWGCGLPASRSPDSGDDSPTASLSLSHFPFTIRDIGDVENHKQPSSTNTLHPRFDNRLSFLNRHSLEALATPAGSVCSQPEPHIPYRIAKTVGHIANARRLDHASFQHVVGVSSLWRTTLP
jgi:hypothetical protein